METFHNSSFEHIMLTKFKLYIYTFTNKDIDIITSESINIIL